MAYSSLSQDLPHALFQQAGINIEGAFATAGLLDDGGDEAQGIGKHDVPFAVRSVHCPLDACAGAQCDGKKIDS